MKAARLIRSMFAMTALAPLVLGCEGPTDPSDPVAEIHGELRVISDPGDPGVPPSTPRPPPRTTRPDIAQYSDLQSDGTLRAWTDTSGATSVFVNVVNVGNMEARGDWGTVSVAGYTACGQLSQYAGGTATTAHTLNPGERGFISVQLPAGALLPCRSYPVQIDTERVMQGGTYGAPDVFANDQARAQVACLQWDMPINGDNFQLTDPFLTGKTLGEIVSSAQIGRILDGHRCSYCHYSGSGLAYSPPVGWDQIAPIGPYDVINNRTWAGPGGYAESFLQRPTNRPDLPDSKPSYLQMLVQRWIDDGQQVEYRNMAPPPAPPLGD